MKRLTLLLLLVPVGCVRGSGLPWTVAEIKMEAGSELEIEGNASMTGGSFQFRLRGPANAHFDRSSTNQGVKVEGTGTVTTHEPEPFGQ